MRICDRCRAFTLNHFLRKTVATVWVQVKALPHFLRNNSITPGCFKNASCANRLIMQMFTIKPQLLDNATLCRNTFPISISLSFVVYFSITDPCIPFLHKRVHCRRGKYYNGDGNSTVRLEPSDLQHLGLFVVTGREEF